MKDFNNWLLPTAIAFYVLSAFLIEGWIQSDEHYQIIEFANYKLGLTSQTTLPWELIDRIRSTVQPLFAYIFVVLSETVGLKSPFLQTFALRILSACLFIYTALRFYRTTVCEFDNESLRKLFAFLTLFFYVFPLMGTRFSSENWSICSFVLGLTIIYPGMNTAGSIIENRRLVFAGLLLGASFLLRFQMGFMLAGLGLWLLLFRPEQWPSWMILLAGFSVSITVGLLVDRWFYGEWTFPAWNYFTANLIAGKAAGFGEEPWWWYFDQLRGSRTITFLNYSLLALATLFIILKYRHPITWIFVPFVLVHTLIGHKEFRFLYPAFFFIPMMICSALEVIVPRKANVVLYATPWLLVNIFAFAASCCRPYDNTVSIFRHLRTLPDQPIVVFFEGGLFYYTLSEKPNTLTPSFYKGVHEIIPKPKPEGFPASIQNIKKPGDTLTFAVVRFDEQAFVSKQWTEVYSPQPAFLQAVNFRDWMQMRGSQWKLYQIPTQ